MTEDLQKASLHEKLDLFDKTWSPKIIARVNEFALRLVKLDGYFIWHHHVEDDETRYGMEKALQPRRDPGSYRGSRNRGFPARN
jgi:hypothetical protein